MKSAKRNTFSVRVTDNATGRSVSFTVAPIFDRSLDGVVREVHQDAVTRWGSGRVTKITDRRHARR